MDDLRDDLIELARRMAYIRKASHPWKKMSDEELLRDAGLILKDTTRQIEGITLAVILLFGKDSTIMSVLPQHKTDAIFRVENLDRYDDRDVIITNLLESYDRMMAFGQKHLSDPFVLEGIQSISARDKILREICSNSLAHRDYSSGYVAKLVIERDQLFTENANRSHDMELCNCLRLNLLLKIHQSPKSFVRSALQTSLDQECEIPTNIQPSTLGKILNLLKAMCFAP